MPARAALLALVATLGVCSGADTKVLGCGAGTTVDATGLCVADSVGPTKVKRATRKQGQITTRDGNVVLAAGDDGKVGYETSDKAGDVVYFDEPQPSTIDAVINSIKLGYTQGLDVCGAKSSAAIATMTTLHKQTEEKCTKAVGDAKSELEKAVKVVADGLKTTDAGVAKKATAADAVDADLKKKLGAVVACLAEGKTVTKDYKCGKKLQEDGAITEATKTKCDATLLGTHRYNTKSRIVEYCVLVGDKKYGFSGLSLSGLGWQKAPGDSAQNPAESCMQIKKRGIKTGYHHVALSAKYKTWCQNDINGGGWERVTRASDTDNKKGNHEFEDAIKGRGKTSIMHWTAGGGKVDGMQYVKPMKEWLPEDKQCSGKIDIMAFCFNQANTGQNYWISGEKINQAEFRKEFKDVDNPDHRFKAFMRGKDGTTKSPTNAQGPGWSIMKRGAPGGPNYHSCGNGYCGQHGFKWSCGQGGQAVQNPKTIWGLVDQRHCSGTNTYSALGVCGPYGGNHLNKFTLDYYFRCSI